jgi:hypothetical protein
MHIAQDDKESVVRTALEDGEMVKCPICLLMFESYECLDEHHYLHHSNVEVSPFLILSCTAAQGPRPKAQGNKEPEDKAAGQNDILEAPPQVRPQEVWSASLQQSLSLIAL